MKYELIASDDRARGLFRIRRLSNGEVGGYVDGEHNLSQLGRCWIDPTSSVIGNARVDGSAYVGDGSTLHGNIHVKNDASFVRSAIHTNTKHTIVIDGDRNTFTHSSIRAVEKDMICIDVNVHDSSVTDSDLKQCVVRNGTVGMCTLSSVTVLDSTIKTCTLTESQCIRGVTLAGFNFDGRVQGRPVEEIARNIYAQTGLPVINGKVIAYKIVRATLSSMHDSEFVYAVGEVASIKHDESIFDDFANSCGEGLHVSTAGYWMAFCPLNGKLLMCEVDINDIIAIQSGKIRCTKLKVLAATPVNEFAQL